MSLIDIIAASLRVSSDMKLWLTKCHGGRYLLTALRPTISRIRGTEFLDAFERVGEPIAVRYLCEAGVVSLLGTTLPELTPTKIEINASLLESKK